jgi:hypothetical protein
MSKYFWQLQHARDVKAAFTRHDHLNDLCGKLRGTELESKLTSPWQSATS